MAKLLTSGSPGPVCTWLRTAPLLLREPVRSCLLSMTSPAAAVSQHACAPWEQASANQVQQLQATAEHAAAYVDDGDAQQAQQPPAVLILLPGHLHRPLAVLGLLLLCGAPLPASQCPQAS